MTNNQDLHRKTMSKGSKRREKQVSEHQMSENWRRIFGNQPQKGCKKKVRKPK